MCYGCNRYVLSMQIIKNIYPAWEDILCRSNMLKIVIANSNLDYLEIAGKRSINGSSLIDLETLIQTNKFVGRKCLIKSIFMMLSYVISATFGWPSEGRRSGMASRCGWTQTPHYIKTKSILLQLLPHWRCVFLSWTCGEVRTNAIWMHYYIQL